ncbi:MAG: NAD-dependent epimerase/dehydratase family protein [Bacteroidetes bacterium]|jgi:nucleoside-diphosphate-sugar epimerase|nr:NAD-dependent epimerase/dehydratase family protein [Bacteroidota bacterium]MBT6685791.1 NAD-dependent epimerase/dehydratase family protein [Bacteroidota bacterium]MBT7142361.1 NAD-dependent epimerase/dehydratase family protein [Bacteroidota bacterium]MBT7490171.1 NAD-dependent epimerase/dehydratase family protein [Bacteroidota bacterium]
MEKILIIGCSGQIGSELTLGLRKIHGDSNVIATDIKEPAAEVKDSGPFEFVDVLNIHQLYGVANRYKITQIYHLAAVLSGNAEKRPIFSWDINMNSLFNILELSRELKIKKVFWPSSIAVFGPTTPRIDTPQFTTMEPNTVYGISKLAGERWIEYYFYKYGVDIRSIRYPGLISYKTEAGGGTTDYAVEIFYESIRNGKYECFLKEDTTLPMMFMADALKATIDLMELEADKISLRSSYNVAAISFSPKDLSEEIKKYIPEFKISYKPDFRQSIAETWPQSIDDSIARQNKGWAHSYDLPKMTEIMIKEIRAKLIQNGEKLFY